MSSSEITNPTTKSVASRSPRSQPFLIRILKPIASLKLTVGLLVLGLLMTWVASLQQTRADIWEVKKQHFSSPIPFVPPPLVYVPLETFCVPAWTPNSVTQFFSREINGTKIGIPLPSGGLLMLLMLINLAAAHTVRFRVKARRAQLLTGLTVLGLGLLLTGMVILNGQNSKGFQAQPIFSWQFLRVVVQIGIGAACVSTVLFSIGLPKNHRLEKVLLWSLAIFLAVVSAFLLAKGESAFIDESAMRILWQLIQGAVGSMVMLVGCIFIFERKSGIVLLHLGLVLLMLGEFYVTYSAVEQRMTLQEGDTVSHTFDIRDFEMAIISENESGTEDVVCIPSRLLKPQDWLSRVFWKNPEVIDDPRIPFKVRPLKYYRNSNLKNIDEELPGNLATTGVGLYGVAIESNINTGTSSEQKIDIATVYAELISKSDNQSLGIFMLNQDAYFNDNIALDELVIDGKTYRFGLRFKHYYKPYSINLIDVKKENYPGTQIAKSFSSEFTVNYPEINLNATKKVWMNNPLRFGNETFYQQSYDAPPGEREKSSLQIVKNTGWMIPYVCCMMVAIGLLAQFGQTLLKYFRSDPDEALEQLSTTAGFLGIPFFRSNRVPVQQVPMASVKNRGGSDNENPYLESNRTKRPLSTWITLSAIIFCLLFFGYWFYAMSTPKKIEHEQMRLDLLGEVPIVYGGRVQPLDSLARNVIKKLTKSGRVSSAVSLRAIAEELEVSEEEANRIIAPLLERKRIVKLVDYDENNPAPQAANPLFVMSSGVLKTSEFPELDVTTLESLNQLFEQASESKKPIHWMADLLFTQRDHEDYFIFKIDHPDVQQALGLKRRPGHRYSYGEVEAANEVIGRDYLTARKIREDNADRLTSYQKKILEIGDTLTLLRQIKAAFQDPLDPFNKNQQLSDYEVLENAAFFEDLDLPLLAGPNSHALIWQSLFNARSTNQLWNVAGDRKLTTVNELAEYLTEQYVNETKRPKLITEMAARLAPEIRNQFPEMDNVELQQWIESRLKDTSPDKNAPLADVREQVNSMISKLLDGERNEAYPTIEKQVRDAFRLQDDGDPLTNQRDLDRGIPFKPEISKLGGLSKAYLDNNHTRFNESLTGYLQVVHKNPPENYSLGRLSAESWLNRASPFFIAWFAYLLAFILSILGWLGWRKEIARVAFSIIVIAMLIHTSGLIARCYISGRPPVTNLYSSALLIGLAASFFYLIIEKILRVGIGNLMAGAIGFTTLMIAMNLSYEQLDTMSVLVAVLDTQFWLATHVVIISLGYSSTYVAGFLGLTYILASIFAPGFDDSIRKKVVRMIYGVTCFSLFFSFVGTVLGGLWADDSWGRFWGWDVKENGALMIVLVNAILLHARWAGVVRDRGIALIAIFGTIVVTWSWFAVNELGVGLHAYADTETDKSTIKFWQTTQFWLFLFWGSQLFVIAAGSFWPQRFWLSRRNAGPTV